ncbi:SAP domain-containing protein [Verrucomicrobiales bacterium BCK34]|nr:SAP domain-containing protein [Verrucomicrobiales bacterium BCK34]
MEPVPGAGDRSDEGDEFTPEEEEEYQRLLEELGKDGPFLIVDTADYCEALLNAVPDLEAEDRETLSGINSQPAKPFRPMGWEASFRHIDMLRCLRLGPQSLKRIAYLTRGYFNNPGDDPLSDGEKVLGESYLEAAARFERLTLIEKTDPELKFDKAFTGADLKTFLKERGLPVSGTKSELIARLLNDVEDPEGVFSGRVSDEMFQLTSAGKEALGSLEEKHKEVRRHQLVKIYRFWDGEESDIQSSLRRMLELIRDHCAGLRRPGPSDCYETISEQALAETVFVAQFVETFEFDEDDAGSLEAIQTGLFLVPAMVDRLSVGMKEEISVNLEAILAIHDDSAVSELAEQLGDDIFCNLRALFDEFLEAACIGKLSKEYTLYDL